MQTTKERLDAIDSEIENLIEYRVNREEKDSNIELELENINILSKIFEKDLLARQTLLIGELKNIEERLAEIKKLNGEKVEDEDEYPTTEEDEEFA